MTEGHRGIRSISERHKQQEAEWRPKVPFLRLKEGERAVVRLLASGEEEDPMLATAFFHRTQSQDAGQTRWRLYYCPATEELDCDRCSEGAKRTEQFGVWAYVYKVLRKEQNPRAKQPGDPGWWDKKALGGEVYFKQIVNGPMFWQRGMGHGQSIWKTIVHYYTQDHDLRKRDYEIIRLGSGLSTVIQIMPGPETSKLTAEQKRLANELPDAFEVLAGREQYPPEGEGDDSSSMETLEDLEEEEVFGGSKKSRRAAVEDDEEEEPAPKAKRRREPEPEEDEEEEAPRRRRRAEPVDEDEEEEEPAPRRTRAAPATKAKRTPPPDDDEDDDDDEEEPPKRRARVARRLEPDDEEEPAPKPKSKTKRTPPPDDDDDEDEEEEIATARQSRRSAVASAASGRRRSTKAASAFDDEEDADDNVQEEDIFDND